MLLLKVKKDKMTPTRMYALQCCRAFRLYCDQQISKQEMQKLISQLAPKKQDLRLF